jgi:ComF family protein
VKIAQNLKNWRAGWEGLLGLVYPRVCAGCQAPLGATGRRWQCEACESRWRRIEPPYCDVCGQGYAASLTGAGFTCSNCAGVDLAFDFAVGAYRNEGLARDLIHRFKYGREMHLADLLGYQLRAVFGDFRLAGSLGAASWILVPVPLHRRRQREREFNQAAELCHSLRRWEPRGDFFFVDALRRVRHTGHQASLDRAGRLQNLQDAFSLAKNRRIREAVDGAEVLLVDDVLTTGATASECARVLKDQGNAAKVVVITVVRG